MNRIQHFITKQSKKIKDQAKRFFFIKEKKALMIICKIKTN